METRFVIINADDFGLTSGINRGITEAHERGLVTSASLMVLYPAARDAAEYARAHSQLSVGLHFDLAEWRCHQGEWRLAYQVVETSDREAVRAEFQRQLGMFQQLTGRAPTHLDSHQHVHLVEPCREVLLEQAAELGVPLRGCTPAIKHEGSFYGQTTEGEPYPLGISLTHLAEVFATAIAGWTEIGCHPGHIDLLDSDYGAEREEEIRVLCSAEARRAAEINEVRLCSFKNYLEEKMEAGARGDRTSARD